MPLKHLTETVLVIVLGLITVITGVLLATLPPIPDGFIPWTVIFALTLLYPAVLYSTLRRNRADYLFRALHFAPVMMALLWLISEIIILQMPEVVPLRMTLTWGWSLLPVATTLILLAAFCLHVIRRRVPRLAVLALLFVPFLVTGYVSETQTQWRAKLQTFLWEDLPVQFALVPPETASVLQNDGTISSAAKSSEEERWRDLLSDVKEGTVHSEPVKPVVQVGSSREGISAVASLVSGSTHLPQSGPRVDMIILLLAAGYATTVHKKTRARAMND